MDIEHGTEIETREPQGVEGTEPAEPSEQEANPAQGEEVQEPAAPAADDTQPDEGGKKTQEDTRFAAARRAAEAERDAAIAKARQDAQAEAQRQVDQFFANAGLVDPYTGRPITSKAEYDAYRQKHMEGQKQEFIRKTGMTPEAYSQFVNDLPEVQAARQAKEEADRAAREARDREARAKIDEQLKEIQAMDPSIKELKDLAKMETYPKLYEMVRRGYSISDAYKLANYDALSTRTAAAGRQAAVTAIQSKQHLSATKPRGEGAVSVPDSVMAEYRRFNPHATREQIQKHYANYIKNQRKE